MRLATIAPVDPSYFEVLDAPVLAGRGFSAADAVPGTRVAIVDQGKLLTCGTLDELLSKSRADLQLRVSGTKARLGPRLVGLAEVESLAEGEAQVILPRDRRDAKFAINDRLTLVLEILKQAGAELLSIETKEHNLERLFLELTGRRLRD